LLLSLCHSFAIKLFSSSNYSSTRAPCAVQQIKQFFRVQTTQQTRHSARARKGTRATQRKATVHESETERCEDKLAVQQPAAFYLSSNRHACRPTARCSYECANGLRAAGRAVFRTRRITTFSKGTQTEGIQMAARVCGLNRGCSAFASAHTKSSRLCSTSAQRVSRPKRERDAEQRVNTRTVPVDGRLLRPVAALVVQLYSFRNLFAK
jgi:hypothetical protein